MAYGSFANLVMTQAEPFEAIVPVVIWSAYAVLAARYAARGARDPPESYEPGTRTVLLIAAVIALFSVDPFALNKAFSAPFDTAANWLATVTINWLTLFGLGSLVAAVYRKSAPVFAHGHAPPMPSVPAPAATATPAWLPAAPVRDEAWLRNQANAAQRKRDAYYAKAAFTVVFAGIAVWLAVAFVRAEYPGSAVRAAAAAATWFLYAAAAAAAGHRAALGARALASPATLTPEERAERTARNGLTADDRAAFTWARALGMLAWLSPFLIAWAFYGVGWTAQERQDLIVLIGATSLFWLPIGLGGIVAYVTKLRT